MTVNDRSNSSITNYPLPTFTDLLHVAFSGSLLLDNIFALLNNTQVAEAHNRNSQRQNIRISMGYLFLRIPVVSLGSLWLTYNNYDRCALFPALERS